MLRLGLTGGIGSGKSTVATRLAELGAEIIDADRIAREVVEPGTPGLAAIAERFGTEVLLPEGTLDRPALGRIVFGDPSALKDLEAITHPAIWALTAERLAATPRATTAVHDMPLLVEAGLAPDYHLVLVVHASVETRVRRLVDLRGMPEEDARARIAAQASEEQRRAVADVWLDNEGTPDDLVARVDALWEERLAPYEANLQSGTRAKRPQTLTLSDPDPEWQVVGRRLEARLRRLLGDRAVTVDHIGSTAVPDLLAKEVYDVQIGVRDLADADSPEFVRALADGGFPASDAGQYAHDNAKDGTVWPKRFFGSADPARFTHVHVREVDSPGWRWALGFREWLRADPSARVTYAAEKRRLASTITDTSEYALAKEPWFDSVHDKITPYAEAVTLPPQPTP